MSKHILYSFRRCPYAIRARLAIASAKLDVTLREVVLRDKPDAFFKASPSATVPCLVTAEGTLDESLDIMTWALGKSDPEALLDMPSDGFDWIARNDGPFKRALDRSKYPSRYPDIDPLQQRDDALTFLKALDQQINGWIFGRPTLADFAILPFIRQFAFIDKDWFDEQPIPNVQNWLDPFLVSERFTHVMTKYPQWHDGDPPVVFP